MLTSTADVSIHFINTTTELLNPNTLAYNVMLHLQLLLDLDRDLGLVNVMVNYFVLFVFLICANL